MSLSTRPHLDLESKEEHDDKLFKEEQEYKKSLSLARNRSNRFESDDDYSFFSKQFVNTIQNSLNELKQSLEKIFGVFFSSKTKINHELYRDYKKVDSKVTSINGFVDTTSTPNSSYYTWNKLTGRLHNTDLKYCLKDGTSVELESLAIRVRATESKIADQHDFSKTVFNGLGSFFYPKSYYNIKALSYDPVEDALVEDDQIEQAIKLFTDYSTNQYIRGHFNRHHTKHAKYLVAKLEDIQLSDNTLEKRIELATELLAKAKNDFISVRVLVNDNKPLDESSFFRRLNFALNKMLVLPAQEHNAQPSI